MELGLSGRIAFVAGSSRGIGLSIARSFLQEGARAVISARSPGSLETARAALAEEFGAQRVLAFCGDFREEATGGAARDWLRAHWGEPDYLVAAVGSGSGRPGWELEESDWTSLFETNLWASVRFVSSFLPGLVSRGSGSIVLIGSIAGLDESLPAPIPYGVAKAALLAYTRNLARSLGTTGVRVNCVAPGNVLAEGGTWERKLKLDADAVTRYVESEVPMKRLGKPSEIADVAVFLASDRASFVTGTCVTVDGGQCRRFS